jgi:Protein of unknown function (DUF3187)
MLTRRDVVISGIATALLLACHPHIGDAQISGGLPMVYPVNPIAQTRTGLYFQPITTPSPGWRTAVSLEYGSLIELNRGIDGQYLFDAEVARLDLSIGRDLSPHSFVRADINLGSASAGFMDGFFNWYHQLFGFHMPERDLRPIDAFGYQLQLPDGMSRVHRPETYLGDLRLTLGQRHGPKAQTVFSMTLPTGTGGPAYSKGTPSFAAMTTGRTAVGSRLALEGSLGFGFTPKHGNLSPYQRELMAQATSGFRFRLWGRQSVYANVLLHSAYYGHTGFPALDKSDLSLNYGWVIRTASAEWRIGMTEDLAPTGPAIDAVFQFSVNWNREDHQDKFSEP